MPIDSTAAWISQRAKQLGFAMCGIVRAEKFPELARTGEWLELGYSGEMKYLHDERRRDLQTAMPGIRSVIVCALTYNTAKPRTLAAISGSSATDEDAAPRGWISRYAWGDDYHGVLRGKLEALAAGLREECPEPFEARVYADTGPIDERVLAKHAGLGWVGKNTLLLNERLGSFFFLGVILTSLELQPSVGLGQAPPADRCGTCRKCIDACPTQALVEPYVMDARRCISYLTIEHRGPIPGEFRETLGQHVFGCDICQDVCPWNRDAPVTNAEEFQPRSFEENYPRAQEFTDRSGQPAGGLRESLFSPRLEWLASLEEQEFRTIFEGSAVKRTKWRGMVRNACIALGNSDLDAGCDSRERVFQQLSRLAGHEDAVISESAQWAISRIQGSDGRGEQPEWLRDRGIETAVQEPAVPE